MFKPDLFKLTFLAVGTLLLFSATVSAEEEWTLESSAKRVLEVSPRIRVADAEISVKEGEVKQAGAWPNPSVGLDANEKLGIEDEAGGTDLTQVSISQPIPIGRLSGQSRMAKASLKSAREHGYYEKLLQESEAARRFHKLQLMSATLVLAQERLQFSEHYGKNEKSTGSKTDALVRYLTPLDQRRLDIVRADASQKTTIAQGEYGEALSDFRALLQISESAPSKAAALEEVQRPDALENLMSLQEKNHPSILAATHDLEALKAGVGLAYGELLPDPSLAYYRERDLLLESRQNFSGVAVNFEVPVWDWKSGSVKKAKSEVEKAEYSLLAVRQELAAELRQTYMHLESLIEQVERHRAEILTPTQEFFELTRKGFEVGETNVLSLLDAHDVYFEARARYQELLYEAAVEAAEVRLATGLSITGEKNDSNNRGGK